MFKELVRLARTMQPPKEWPTYDGKLLDRTEFLTSSEVSTCLRQAYFAKNPDYPPKLGGGFGSNGYAERGHAIEAWLVEQLVPLELQGYRLLYMGEDQRSFYDAELGLSGTPDGVLVLPDGEAVLQEFKSIDPRTNKNNLPRKKHIRQTVQNMYLVNKCLFDDEGQPNSFNPDIASPIVRASLTYIDASDVLDMQEYEILLDKDLLELSFERGEMLWGANGPDELEPEGVYTGDCERCPFTQHCSATIDLQKMLEKAGANAAPFVVALGEEGQTEGLNAEEIEAIETYIAAKEGEKQYADEKASVDAIVKELVMRFGGVVSFDGNILTGRMSSGRETLDKKAMIADGVDVAKYTGVGKPFVTLTVKAER